MFQLMQSAYSTIGIQDTALFLGMNEDHATNCKPLLPCLTWTGRKIGNKFIKVIVSNAFWLRIVLLMLVLIIIFILVEN